MTCRPQTLHRLFGTAHNNHVTQQIRVCFSFCSGSTMGRREGYGRRAAGRRVLVPARISVATFCGGRPSIWPTYADQYFFQHIVFQTLIELLEVFAAPSLTHMIPSFPNDSLHFFLWTNILSVTRSVGDGDLLLWGEELRDWTTSP